MNKELILEQAVNVFADINARINLLIDCSAKDFDILHQGFIEYHSKLEELTDNTSRLFEGLLTIPEAGLKEHLAHLDRLSAELKALYEISSTSVQAINQLIKDIAYAFLYVNNQKQNISTLKLLITHIQLEPESRSLYAELIGEVNHLQLYSKQMITEFQNKERRVQACADSVERIRTDQLPIVIQSLDHYAKLVSGLMERKKLCSEYSSILKELISKKSVSSSEIITNLQFQDIIRQKIEHVQEAQTKLLIKLENFTPKDSHVSKESHEEAIQIIFQIRDIGALQAAQMVHANNEYQKAVEVITEKFEELDHILIETTRLLNNLTPELDSMSDFSFDEITKSKAYLELEFDTLKDSVTRLEKMHTDICRKDEILISSNSNINSYLKECQITINKLNIKEGIPSSTDSTNLNFQLRSNFESFIHNSDELNKLLEINHQKIEKKIIPNLENLFNRLSKLEQQVELFVENSNLLFADKNISKNSEKITGNKKDLIDKKFDPNAIQYYSVFDKEIEEIISNLNKLISTIDFKEFESEFDKMNLGDIKKLYTMESEREIHSMVTGEKKNTQTNNDDLELF